MDSINTSYYLPHYCKKIGWILAGLSIVVYLSLFILVNILEFISIIKANAYVSPFLPILLTVGMAMIISSREKREDEMIRLIRLKSFQYGIYAAVVLFIYSIIFETGTLMLLHQGIIDGHNEYWVILGFMLMELGSIPGTLFVILVIYHAYLFKAGKDEE